MTAASAASTRPLGRPARTPALALTVFFVAGEATGWPLRGPFGLLLPVSLFSAAAVLVRRRRLFVGTAFVLAGFLLLGAYSYRHARFQVDHQDLLELYRSLGRGIFQHPCLVEGRLRMEPQFGFDRAVLLLDVERLTIGGRASPSSGGLQANVYGAQEIPGELARLRTGDRIRLWAVLRRPRSFMNPGAFDVAEHLKRRGVVLVGSVKSARLVERTQEAPWWESLGSRVRGFVRSRIHLAYESPVDANSETPGILIALLVADRSRIPAWAGELYRQAGTFHVIAISGAHVGILAWFLHGSIRRMGLDQRSALLVLLIVLPLYAGLCGGGAPVVRAVLMSLVVIGARLLGLDSAGMNGLALSALLLLVVRPLDLEDPGFQLSFFATASILAFAPPLSGWLRHRVGWVSPLVAVSLAAQMGVVPILAWHFQRLTPIAVGANLIAVPLSAGLIVSGAVLVTVAPLPWIGPAMAWIAMCMVKALTFSSQVAVAVPGGSLRVSTPSWAWLGAYVLILTAAVVIQGWWRRVMMVGLCSLILGLVAAPAPPTSGSHLTLTALDVGNGDAILLELPGGEKLLIDGGGSSSRLYDMGENVLVPALLHAGIRDLDAVVVTHSDADHIGGLPAVISNLRVQEIWEGSSDWQVRTYRELRARAWDRRVRVRRLSIGDELRLGEVLIKVLSAGGAGRVAPQEQNDRSLVLQLFYGRGSILLTGDAGRETELNLILSRHLAHADVLKVGHHGSNSSTHPAFLEAVSPRLAVVSARPSGRFRLPSARVLRYLKVRGIPILRTDRDGAVTVQLDRNGTIGVETHLAPNF